VDLSHQKVHHDAEICSRTLLQLLTAVMAQGGHLRHRSNRGSFRRVESCRGIEWRRLTVDDPTAAVAHARPLATQQTDAEYVENRYPPDSPLADEGLLWRQAFIMLLASAPDRF